MGIRLKGIKYFEEITSILDYKNFNGLRLCQLGDLYIRGDARNYGIIHGKALNYFKDLEFEVVTIDLGIGHDKIGPEVLQYDLSKPILENVGRFDFIIDFGTSEHIDNQYELFKNVHNLCKVNGVMIHSNPSTKYGSDHGLFHFTFSFYRQLARVCKYRLIDVREMPLSYWTRYPEIKNHIYASLYKVYDNEFPASDIFKTKIMKELVVVDGREQRSLEKRSLEKRSLEKTLIEQK